MRRDIHVEAFYPHPIELVWEALTDSDALAEWLMPNDFVPKLGHKFQFRTKPAPGFDGIVDCKVIEIVKGKRLSFTWKGGPLDTLVTFNLEPLSNGTRLKLEQKGFEGIRAVLVSFILGKGWKKKILPLSLPSVLDRLAARQAARSV
ncbi:MAG: SRPBCC domain-containing protein [Acidobacteriota bacterium]